MVNRLDSFSDLFSRSLKRMSQSQPGTRMADADEFKIYYTYNSHGYRCDDFDDQQVLTLGCSQTLGIGLPLGYTWPFLLAKKMNMSYANLAKGGDSAQGQVIKAFQFFKEFHNPKYIFGVFPLARMEMPYIKNFLAVTKNPVILDEDKDKQYIQSIFLRNSKLEKFSKIPYAVDEVLPEDVAIFYNLMFIQMLEQYCNTNGIKFLWTFYDDTTNPIGNQISSDNHFSSSLMKVKKDDTCHQEHSSDLLFHKAADNWHKDLGHWGLHKQIHIAEAIHSML